MAANTAIYGPYDQAALNQEYDNRAKVPDAGRIVDGWYAEGRQAAASLSCHLDIAYAQHDRQRLDIFPAAQSGAPILAFIHGGYWQSRDRQMAHFLAPFYVASGVTFASIGYRLCPDAGIVDILADVRTAIHWLHDNGDRCGSDSKRLYVAGHSAGGHLAAMLCGPVGPGRAVVRGGCTISGLHDLEPIRLSYLNDILGLDAPAAAALSPIEQVLAMTPGAPGLPALIAAVGTREGPEYLRQRDELVAVLRSARQPVQAIDIIDGDHFSACAAFADPAHPLQEAMMRMIFAPDFTAPD